jgi:hypothetical protein
MPKLYIPHSQHLSNFKSVVVNKRLSLFVEMWQSWTYEGNSKSKVSYFIFRNVLASMDSVHTMGDTNILGIDRKFYLK